MKLSDRVRQIPSVYALNEFLRHTGGSLYVQGAAVSVDGGNPNALNLFVGRLLPYQRTTAKTPAEALKDMLGIVANTVEWVENDIRNAAASLLDNGDRQRQIEESLNEVLGAEPTDQIEPAKTPEPPGPRPKLSERVEAIKTREEFNAFLKHYAEGYKLVFTTANPGIQCTIVSATRPGSLGYTIAKTGEEALAELIKRMARDSREWEETAAKLTKLDVNWR